MYLLHTVSFSKKKVIPWKESLGVMSVQGVDVGVTKSIGDDFDSYLSSFGRIDL